MDSVTHLVSGGLLAVAFPKAPRRAAFVLFGMVAASAPDIDALFSGGDPVSMMTLHRGITHALIMQPLLAAGVVLPFFLLLAQHRICTTCPAQEAPLRKIPCGMALPTLFACGMLCLFMHLFLDSMTTFGTQIFLPFSSMRVALPAMFIIDPLITLPAIVLLVAALHQPPEIALCLYCHAPAKQRGYTRLFSERAQRLARAGVCWMILYPLCTLALNFGLTAYYAAQEHLPQGRITLLTEPASPLIWKRVIEEDAHFRMQTVLARPSDAISIPKANAALLDNLARQGDLMRHFQQFAPLMGHSSEPMSNPWNPAESLVQHTFFSMRYAISPRSLMRLFRVTETYFAVQALVDDAGIVRAIRFVEKLGPEPVAWTEKDRVLIPFFSTPIE